MAHKQELEDAASTQRWTTQQRLIGAAAGSAAGRGSQDFDHTISASQVRVATATCCICRAVGIAGPQRQNRNLYWFLADL
jgi:hypothetical protein